MPGESEPTSSASALVKSGNAFAFDLWAKVRRRPGNLAMSPASVAAAIAMTYGGAKTETAAQIKSVLHLEGDPDGAMPQWGALATLLQDPARPRKLRIANRLFGEQACPFEAAFLEKTARAYGAPLEAVDFKGAAETARRRINGWVEQQTEQRIKNLLSGPLSPETRLVLVNAIYFLADWLSPFQALATRSEPFRLSATQTINVRMMHRTGSYLHAKSEGSALLEMPYVGGDASMFLLLPDRVDGLPEIEASLSSSTLKAWQQGLCSKGVVVSLPSFTIDPPDAMDLVDDLHQLGMSLAFDRDRAGFTGIANPPDPRDRLFVSAIFHKAFVKVDEKGTEAAAATAVLMAPGAGRAPPPPVEFKVDRPFLFFIVDKPTGLILFVGRVTEPVVGGT
jgi:serpin B